MTDTEDKTDIEIPVMMKMPGTLVFTAEGEWLHDGELITHKKIRDYFCARLRYSEEHKSDVIEVDGKCVSVKVEDTRIVVRTFDTSSWPWSAQLSSGKVEPFSPATLSVSTEGIFYCKVNGGKERARILRPAWQAILPWIFEAGGGYEFRKDEHSSPIEEEKRPRQSRSQE